MISSYTPWWISYLLIHACTFGRDQPWWIFPAMVPIVVVAAVSCAGFDSDEKRLEHECRKLNLEREVAAYLQKRLGLRARVVELTLPSDEKWARDVERILGFDDERTN